MIAFKNKYFLIIENTRDIDLRNIKLINKFVIIYRSIKNTENRDELVRLRKECRLKKIAFYVANDLKLLSFLKADGLYVSAHNKSLNFQKIKKSNYEVIGSAHNIRELNIKKLQGCTNIIYSRLFETSYKYKKGFLGIIKFNLLNISVKENLVPLGGITINRLNKLRLVKTKAFAFSSEVKKKPAKIFSRLF